MEVVVGFGEGVIGGRYDGEEEGRRTKFYGDVGLGGYAVLEHGAEDAELEGLVCEFTF